MKIITFEGKQYEVEDWVRYAARDEDNEIYGYDVEPAYRHVDWNPRGPRILFLGKHANDVNWKESLIEV